MPDVTSLPATFTTAQVLDAGIHPRELYRWRDEGEVTELSRGVYRRADAPQPSHPELLAISYRVPIAITCLLSAAALYELTDELPRAVQIAIPRGKRVPRIAYPQVEVFLFDPPTFDLGLESIDAVPGEPVRVYSPARTVVDLMRFRNQIGDTIAHIALRRYLQQRGSRPALLLKYARALDVAGPIRAAIDVLEAS